MKNNNSMTLIELLIASVLLSFVIFGLLGIEVFSRHHLVTAERRAQTQNEVSHVLEHISKNATRAIGNERINGANTVVDIIEATGDNERSRAKFYVDGDSDGVRDTPVVNPAANQDHWMAYRYFDNLNAVATRRNTIQFCERCRNKNCNQCNSGWETVSLRGNRVSGLELVKPQDAGGVLTNNYIEATVSACWDPAESVFSCGSPDNPRVTMRARIKMPSVATN